MKYIIYCRKSTDEADRQVLSIESQITELKEFAKREKLEVEDCVTESKTAKVPGREKFNQVIKRIEKGEVQGLIAWHADRLARNTIDGGKIIYLLDTGQLQDLKFPTLWFDNTPQGKFMLSIAFSQSKYYIDNLSENIRRGIRQKIRRGEWPSKAPYGYLNDPKSRTIEVDTEISKIVKKSFQLFLKGNSFTEVSKYIFKFGVNSKNGKPLKINQIRRMLTNKFYIGVFKYAGEYHEASHKQFISKKLFQATQKRLFQIQNPRKRKHNFPFIGMARCGECGRSITAESHTKYYKGTDRVATYNYYRCTKKLGTCKQKSVFREDEFENQLRDRIQDVAIPTSWSSKWLNWIEEDRVSETKLASQNLIRTELEQRNLDEKLNKLLDGYLEGVIDPEIYKNKKNELFEDKQETQEKIAFLKQGHISWIEPFEEFIKRSINCGKIACGKNNSDELAFVGKSVGSNFFLCNSSLTAEYKKGFDTVFSERARIRARTPSAEYSLCVETEGIEPSSEKFLQKDFYRLTPIESEVFWLIIFHRHIKAVNANGIPSGLCPSNPDRKQAGGH